MTEDEKLDVACRSVTLRLMAFFEDPENGDFERVDFEAFMLDAGFKDDFADWTTLRKRLIATDAI